MPSPGAYARADEAVPGGDQPPGRPGGSAPPAVASLRPGVALLLLAVAAMAAAAIFAAWRTGWPSAVFGPRKAARVSAAPTRPGSSQTPGRPASPRQQQAADSLASLLAQSVSDRSAVNDAYNDVMQCGAGLEQDVQTFRNAVTSRQRLVNQLAGLPSQSALSPLMLQDLAGAWRESSQADSDYAGWAQDQISAGCTANSTSDPNYAAADNPNLQATADKTAFTSLWDPLAARYGLTAYQQDNL